MATVLNIAHRGFTRDYPDNTLEAFEAAIGIPADGIECDVRETSDGELVMFHDPELEGRDFGLLSAADVRDMRLAGGCRIPTLRETLDLCRQRVLLNIEIKQVAALDRLVALVSSRLTEDEVVLTSFNRGVVVELSRLAPDIRRGVITAGQIDDPVELAATTMSDIIVLRHPHASADTVRISHDSHRPVFVWGCAGISEARAAMALGIDGIITDFPDEIREAIIQMRSGG